MLLDEKEKKSLSHKNFTSEIIESDLVSQPLSEKVPNINVVVVKRDQPTRFIHQFFRFSNFDPERLIILENCIEQYKYRMSTWGNDVK